MRTLTAALVALSFVAVAPSWADVVELKTGQRVEGTFKQATPAEVEIEIGGQTIRFDIGKVRAIYFGSAPTPIPQQAGSAAEALRALKAVQSVTSGGVDYREYSARVNDAKVLVDRFLDEDKSAPEALAGAVKAAMDFYGLAARAWNARISRSNYEAVAADPALRQCPQMEPIISRGRAMGCRMVGDAAAIGIGVAMDFSPLWQCASEKLCAADQAIRQGK